MCRQIIFTNLNKVKDLNDLTLKAAEILENQRDGFGAAIAREGKLRVLKTLSPTEFLNGPGFAPTPDFCKPTYQETSRPIAKNASFGLFHGRISTNALGYVNTHPIERENHLIVHNGVVTHHGPTYDKVSSNDTEDVLFNFIRGGIHYAAENLTGYYAAAIVDDLGILHIFRDAIAKLSYAWLPGIESHIFATSAEDLLIMAEYLGETVKVFSVKDDVYLKFDGNNLVVQDSFKSRGYGQKEAHFASKSLGYSLEESLFQCETCNRNLNEDEIDDEASSGGFLICKTCSVNQVE